MYYVVINIAWTCRNDKGRLFCEIRGSRAHVGRDKANDLVIDKLSPSMTLPLIHYGYGRQVLRLSFFAFFSSTSALSKLSTWSSANNRFVGSMGEGEAETFNNNKNERFEKLSNKEI